MQGIAATLKASDGRAQQRSAEREAIRLAKAMDIKSFHGFKSKAKTTAVSSARVVKSIGKTLDVFGGAVESLFAAPQTPERIEQAENSRFRREAEAEHSLDFTRFTSDTAHQGRQEENEREAARERQRDEERGRER